MRVAYYVAAKFLTLCAFSALQCTLFILVGNAITVVAAIVLYVPTVGADPRRSREPIPLPAPVRLVPGRVPG